MNDTLKTMTAEIETATHAVDVAAGCIQNAYELLASTPKHHTRIMADRTAGYEYAQAHYHNMVEKANELRCKLKVLVESLGGKVWWHINGLVAKIEIPDMVTVNERHIVYNSTVMPGLNFGVANWNQTLQDLVNNMVALCDDILEARRDKEDAYVAVLEAYFESGEKAEKWCCCGPTKKEMAALIRRVAYFARVDAFDKQPLVIGGRELIAGSGSWSITTNIRLWPARITMAPTRLTPKLLFTRQTGW